MRKGRRAGRSLRWGGPSSRWLAPILTVAFLLGWSAASLAEEQDSCVDCHGNRRFLVTDKKLYDYFQQWTLSVHRQEDVSCVDCHGGNPGIADKEGAHGGDLSGEEVSSAVNFKNIPDTCGECHEQIYRAYRESDHSEYLVAEEDAQQGPNCVTCHGSMSTGVLDVNTIRESCARCHNEKTDNHPENPERATAILNKFLSIHRFYRYITVRGSPEDSRKLFEEVDEKIDRLSVTWHTFDLDEIEAETRAVLDLLKMQRDELRRTIRAAGDAGNGAGSRRDLER
jgi:hypothetical protein